MKQPFCHNYSGRTIIVVGMVIVAVLSREKVRARVPIAAVVVAVAVACVRNTTIGGCVNRYIPIRALGKFRNDVRIVGVAVLLLSLLLLLLLPVQNILSNGLVSYLVLLRSIQHPETEQNEKRHPQKDDRDGFGLCRKSTAHN